MAEVIIDKAFVAPYFQNGKKGVMYKQAMDIYYHMSFHADGFFLKPNVEDENGNDVDKQNPYFKRLIDTIRPQESDRIKDYRRKVYLPKTMRPYYKVYSSLRKIVKSQDWKIDYANSDKPKSSIADGEYLEDYCEKDYPYFNSLENWMYNYAMNLMLTDPNALLVIMPTELEDNNELEAQENEYLTPYTYIIPSKDVLDYREEKYAVYLSDEKSIYKDESGKDREGDIVVIITAQSIFKAYQINAKKDFDLRQVYDHDCEYLPAWRMGGTIKKMKKGDTLYKSFLSPMLPDLDRAAREVSDLDAEVIQHIYSQMWYYSGQECTSCNGLGKVRKGGDQIVCPQCQGQGVMAKSPYKDLVVKAPGLDEKNVPTPPIGYVQKNTDIVKIQDERIKQHIYDALSSINMEFLANIPLSQSGTAKEVDRDELNNFVYSVAYHIVEEILKNCYYFIAKMRYKDSIRDEDAIDKMLPTINIPESFNLLTENILMTRLKTITDSKAAKEISKQVQIDFVNKTFADMPEVRDKVITALTIDPFSDYTPEEKQNLSLSKLVPREDILLSIYINDLIERAIDEDEKFLTLDRAKKKEKLLEYVEEIIQKLDGAQENADNEDQDQQIKPGATITVPSGKEKDPAHAGVPMKVMSVKGGKVSMKMPNGMMYNGYTTADLTPDKKKEEPPANAA